MTTKHPVKCTGRDQFVACQSDYWSTAKKTGNLYVRDFDCTYTIVPVEELASIEIKDGEVVNEEPAWRVVIVGVGGVRKDLGPFPTREALFRELWPEGESRPVSP